MPTFDGGALTMTMDAPTAGVLSQNVGVDWYKEWKLWVLAGNFRYPAMFDEGFGGNNAPDANTKAGAYYVLQNKTGWRIKPFEATHTVNVLGNLLPQDATLPMMKPTTGGFTVFVNGIQPITTIAVNNVGSGLSTTQDTMLTRIHALLDVIEGTTDHAEAMRLILAAAQGNATGLESGSPAFSSMDGTKVRIAATYTAGTRTITSRDAT